MPSVSTAPCARSSTATADDERRSVHVLLAGAGRAHRAELRTHIDRLALEHGTPAFEPHVTLASGLVDPTSVVAAIQRVAGDRAPLEVVAGPTAHGPDRFKAVFVELDDDRLHEMAAAVCAELGLTFDPAELRPHISLIYAADLPRDTRPPGMAAEHTLEGRTLRFDTLVASVPANDIDDVACWQSPVVRRLSRDP